MIQEKTIVQKGALCLLILAFVGMAAYKFIDIPEPVEQPLIVDARFVAIEKAVPEIEVAAEEVEPDEPITIADTVAEVASVTYVNDDAATYIAKTVWGEARGLSATEQAAVMWCILNRVDAYGSDVVGVVTAPNQFHGYSAYHPVTDEIYSLAVDVIQRWQNEKNGAANVGRVLPKEYLYFYGSGGHNHFTTRFRGGYKWDWSLPSPY